MKTRFSITLLTSAVTLKTLYIEIRKLDEFALGAKGGVDFSTCQVMLGFFVLNPTYSHFKLYWKTFSAETQYSKKYLSQSKLK